MIQFSTTQNPFTISFTKNKNLIMTLQVDADSAPEIHSDSDSLTAKFPRLTLNLKHVSDHWALSTTPTDSPHTIRIQLLGHLYGHGELIHQQFPLNKLMIQSSPLHTFDNGPTGLSGVLNPTWFSSNGTLIIGETFEEVGINQPPENYPRYKWQFASEGRGPFSHRPFFDEKNDGDKTISITGNALDLKFYFTENALQAYEKQVAYFGHAKTTPPESLFTKPTWTTWAKYKTEINQEVILQFANQIIEHDYPYNVLEIDDRWQVYYGDLDFDPKRFPNPKKMIDELHDKGFKVTTWVIPFLDPQSDAFAEGEKNNFLVKTKDGSPYLVEWWQGRGALLDVTNLAGVEWFFTRLKQLQIKTGCDGFKFDAGEACFFPLDAVTHQKIHPNQYTNLYVNAVAKHYGLTEVRSGWKNQNAPIFFRQWDKTTAWGLDNGLHSVLTGMFAMGLAGYPFILPDMIGGNEYEEKADAEMMIRWTQLNALLPAMQFSLPPWDYGNECTEICRRYTNLHVEFSEKIFQVANEATQNGNPIIRPIFWLDANDETALTCDDEFLLGDEFLVAPVVKPNIRERNIYIPKGTWRDCWTKEIFEGSQWLKNYPAPLDTLVFFEKI
jgi:myogenesis-regulating glycosidase